MHRRSHFIFQYVVSQVSRDDLCVYLCYFRVTGGECLLGLPHRHEFRAAVISLLESLNIIIGWGCWDVSFGAAALSSSGSPGGEHLHRLGSHQINVNIYIVAVSHVFFVPGG